MAKVPDNDSMNKKWRYNTADRQVAYVMSAFVKATCDYSAV